VPHEVPGGPPHTRPTARERCRFSPHSDGAVVSREACTAQHASDQRSAIWGRLDPLSALARVLGWSVNDYR